MTGTEITHPLEAALPAEPLSIVDAARNAAERVHDMTLSVVADVHAAVIERASSIADNWDGMPVWKRAAVRTAGVLATGVGMSLAMRATGAAAHGIEQVAGVGHLPMVSSHAAETPAWHLPAPVVAPAGHAVESANGHDMTPASFVTDDNGTLPADLDAAPAPQALEAFNPKTGSGTVWHQVEVYEERMGYHLNDHQQHELVGKILDRVGLSWDEARDLDSSYKLKLPTQSTMTTYLNDMHAHITHTPDRAVPVTEPPHVSTGRHDGHPGEPSGDSSWPPVSASPAPDASHDRPFALSNPFAVEDWHNWTPFERPWDTRDTVAAVAIGGVAVLAIGLPLATRRARHRADDRVVVVPQRTADSTVYVGGPTGEQSVIRPRTLAEANARPATVSPSWPPGPLESAIRRGAQRRGHADDTAPRVLPAEPFASTDEEDRDRDGIDDRTEPNRLQRFIANRKVHGWLHHGPRRRLIRRTRTADNTDTTA